MPIVCELCQVFEGSFSESSEFNKSSTAYSLNCLLVYSSIEICSLFMKVKVHSTKAAASTREHPYTYGRTDIGKKQQKILSTKRCGELTEICDNTTRFYGWLHVETALLQRLVDRRPFVRVHSSAASTIFIFAGTSSARQLAPRCFCPELLVLPRFVSTFVCLQSCVRALISFRSCLRVLMFPLRVDCVSRCLRALLLASVVVCSYYCCSAETAGGSLKILK